MTAIDPKISGKLPIIPPVLNSTHARPTQELVRQLALSSTPELSDLVGRLYTMTPEIRPLYASCPPLAGAAVTVRTPRGDNKAVKEAVSEIKAGDVLVIDAQGFTEWCNGGYGMLREATSRGLLTGVVVNGAYRDVTEFRNAGLPLYGISLNPATGPKLGVGQINVPVSCGNVIVYPGDILIGDDEGIVVIPHQHSELVANTIAARRAGS